MNKSYLSQKPYLGYKEVPSIDLFPWANRSIIVPGVPHAANKINFNMGL